MFFVLSKALFFLINPLIWILTCIVMLFFVKRVVLKKILLISAIFLLLFFGNNFFFTLVGRQWEITSLPASTIDGHYKYAVVLGGMGSENKTTGKFHIGQSIDRILQAIIVYKQGKVDKILITGGSGSVFTQGRKEAPLVRKFCMDMGVAEDDVIIEDKSRNTHENATLTKAIIGTGEGKILLITSAIHMRRSMGCFKKEGFEFDYLATDPMTLPEIYFEDMIIPKGDAIFYWNALIKEMVGTIIYKVSGYI